MINKIRKNKFYRILIWILTIAILILTIFQTISLYNYLGIEMVDDFVEYWSAGNLNLSGQNPYDPQLMLTVERSVGYENDRPLIMWNPPGILPIAMVFSLFDYPFSRSLWILINIVVILVCAIITWEMYGGNQKQRWIAWLITLTFLPVFIQLVNGQSGFLVLAGIVGFLFFIRRDQSFLAGVFLSLAAVKPHVIYLLFLAVIIWSIFQRKWFVLLGLSLGIVLSTLIAYMANPKVVHQYIFAIINYPPSEWIPSTIGSFLRSLIDPQNLWILFIPAIFGNIWLIYYWFINKTHWDWLLYSPLIILVSALTTPYGWIHDHVISLVPVIQIFVLALAVRRYKNPLFFSLLSIYTLINIIQFLRNDVFYFWFATAILLFYLGAKMLIKKVEAKSSNEYSIETYPL